MNLNKLRKKVDKLDSQIVALLNQRAGLVKKIGKLKEKKSLSTYMPDRESEIYERVLKENKGPLSDSAIRSIYREIMSSALALERRPRIAYLGPAATFTHLAALKKFGAQVEYNSCNSITDIFRDVETERSDYGVVPIENSTEGIVSHTLDMFIDSDLKICSEISLEVSHNLLGRCKISEVKKVYSNPQVFGQCRLWLEDNLSEVEFIEVSTTSKAAELASKERFSCAIASSLAAQKYRLNILAKGIEDSSQNVTRFLVIGERIPETTGKDKTSIMFSVKDRVGALHDMLSPFKKNRINLTKIESRPSKRKAWEYYFFVDLEGHCRDRHVKRALSELEKDCAYLKILGSYPVGM